MLVVLRLSRFLVEAFASTIPLPPPQTPSPQTDAPRSQSSLRHWPGAARPAPPPRVCRFGHGRWRWPPLSRRCQGPAGRPPPSTRAGSGDAGADSVAADAPVAECHGDGAGKAVGGVPGGDMQPPIRGAGHGRAGRVGMAGPPPAAILAGSAAPAIRYTDLTVTACGPSRCWPVVAGQGPQHDHARVAPPLR